MIAALQGSNHGALLCGCHPTEDAVPLKDIRQLRLISRQLTSVKGIISTGNSSLRRNRSNSHGVVTADHLDSHTLLEEVRNSVGCIWTQGLVDDNKCMWLHPGKGTFHIQVSSGNGAQHDHTCSPGGQLIGSAANHITIRQQHLGCTEDP